MILGIFGILNFFLIFSKSFGDSTLHGTLGKKFFWKNRPKTFSKHVWTLLGTILGIFGILENFWFFWKFSKTRPSMEHCAKKFFKKITLKHLQNTFGHFWERFWACLDFWNFFVFEKFRLDTFGDDFGHFWNFENFLIFLKLFEDSTLHGTLGKKFSRKNYPKTTSEHVWTLLGTILGIFGILKIFWFFRKFSETRPSMEHWAKIFSGKIALKHFQTRLDTFGNDFGHFWNFGKLLNFLKIFEDSTLHGTLDEKFFRKNHP